MRVYLLTDRDLPKELIPVREVFLPKKKDKPVRQVELLPDLSTPGHDSFLKAKERMKRRRELA